MLRSTDQMFRIAYELGLAGSRQSSMRLAVADLLIALGTGPNAGSAHRIF
jgi:hypothetical protein